MPSKHTKAARLENMSCNVPPIIKHLKAFCWHLYKKNRWVCSVWFWSHFDANLATAHNRRSFAGSSWKKKWLNFDTESADKLLKVLPTYRWTDSLIIESILLDWSQRNKGEETSFPKALQNVFVFQISILLFGGDTAPWLVHHILSGSVQNLEIFVSSEKLINLVHKWSNVTLFWFLFQFFTVKVLLKFGGLGLGVNISTLLIL